MQYSLASFNAGRRGELVCGNARNRARQRPAIRMKSANGEKLNHERGEKPLPVSATQDGAEPR